jgi:hypothetical protein
MNWCHETTKMGVPARHASQARRAGTAISMVVVSNSSNIRASMEHDLHALSLCH